MAKKENLVRCEKPKCTGVLFNVSSRLATALNVMHVECDKCHARFAIKVKEKNRE